MRKPNFKVFDRSQWKATRLLGALELLLLAYAAIIGGIVLYQRIQAWQLGGVCPVPLQRPWTLSALAAALIVLGITLWQDLLKKRAGK